MARKPAVVVHGPSRLTEHDIYLFREGRHFRLYDRLGAHPHVHEGKTGVLFAVWAPNAAAVSVVGDFNGWNPEAHPLALRPDGSGIFEGFVPGVAPGVHYKYRLRSTLHDFRVDKSDPFAFATEPPPRTASQIHAADYVWGDGDWMQQRGERNRLAAPMSIYEAHLGSWQRVPEEDNRPLSYLELAERLGSYLEETGFTHVELLPVMEHPFYGSWGYQVTGYFAPTARYGAPEGLMQLIDSLHQRGIGVILDWVPSHFPMDEHGLIYFDGTHLYEHADPRQGVHRDWQSAIFNYGRYEVRSFLISSAMFWLDRYHVDGLRVDAVASMLYLNYSRPHDEWIPNYQGGNENLEAIEFLRSMNTIIYRDHPDVQVIAEESTAWPLVSRPTSLGGLGFGLKWNMGWMHDTLDFMRQDPVFRKFRMNQLTFSLMYAFHENFVLSLSHDEVVHGKGSLLGKMPGDDWQKFANLRLLYGYMWGHPGKKLLFMGGEFGQWREWNHDQSLDWHLLEQEPHRGLKRWLEDLNRFYRQDGPLYQCDFSPEGFRWIDCHDTENSVIAFLRQGADGHDLTLVVLNFTPVPRSNYRLGVPRAGHWHEVLNSDARLYGGAGWGNLGTVETRPVPAHGEYDSLCLTLPPLGVLYLKPGDGG